MKKKFFLLLICSPLLVSAQVTLDECQQWAAENYPLTQRYDLLEQTSKYTLENLQKGWLPQITASAQATYQSAVVELPNALKSMMEQMGTEVKGLKKDQYKVALDVNQAIFDGGMIKNQKEVAKLQQQVQNAQNDVDLYALKDRINNLFFSVLLMDERLKLNSDLQNLLQVNLDKLQAMKEGGVVMQSDVDRVKVELLQAKQTEVELESSKNSLLQVLALFCGKKSSELTNLQKPAMQDASGINNRPELTLFDSQIRLAEAQEKVLKSSLRPKIGLFAQGYYGYPGYNMYEDMFSHKWSLNGLIGARITWNISNFYTNKNERRKLAVQRELVENARDVYLFNNNLQNTQDLETISRYQKLMKEDDDIILLRKAVRESTEAKLEGGIINTSDLVKEITSENQASIAKSTHELEMLKAIYEQKTLNNN